MTLALPQINFKENIEGVPDVCRRRVLRSTRQRGDDVSPPRGICRKHRGTTVHHDLFDDKDSHSTDNDKITRRNLLIATATCLVHTKDFLALRNDHVVHFISTDYDLSSQITKDLVETQWFTVEDLQKVPGSLGDATTLPSNKYHVFHLFVKNSSSEYPSLANVEACIKNLGKVMNFLGIFTCSVSKNQNGLDQIPWASVETILQTVFFDKGYTITVCSNELKFPSEHEQEAIVKEYHESVVGGHQGISKLYNRIRDNYYWKGMKQDIINFIRTCSSCQRNKLARIKTRQPLRITDTPQQAFDKVQMDIVGPLPVTEKGNRYLLTLQDNLTKYSDAIPLPTIDAITVALALAEKFISRFGCPRAIHTDQGSNFMSNIMKNFCQIFKIQQIKSTAFHPQSLGSLERAHHTFIEYLKHYCTKRNWDQWIRFGMFSYNTSVHESTGFTPHELIFGRKARIPSEFSDQQIPRTFIQYFDDLFTIITTTQATAVENLERAKAKSKKLFDRHSNSRVFQVGDDVYLLQEPRQSKFDPHWKGPFKITRIFDDLNAEIQINKNNKKIVHTNKLKLAYIRPTSPLGNN